MEQSDFVNFESLFVDFERLKEEHRDRRTGFPLDMRLRVHRALSWGRRAEQEGEDYDIAFLLLWIGFNSVYARKPGTELEAFRKYFKKIVPLDKGLLFKAVWNEEFFTSNSDLVGEKFLFEPFWKFQTNPRTNENWEKEMEEEKRRFDEVQSYGDAQKKLATAEILVIIFSRLYVLRNQLMHGGATWDGQLNRESVLLGTIIMRRMLPIFIKLMMDNPKQNWGRAAYFPVVEQ